MSTINLASRTAHVDVVAFQAALERALHWPLHARLYLQHSVRTQRHLQLTERLALRPGARRWETWHLLELLGVFMNGFLGLEHWHSGRGQPKSIARLVLGPPLWYNGWAGR